MLSPLGSVHGSPEVPAGATAPPGCRTLPVGHRNTKKTVLPRGTCVCVLTIKAMKTSHDPRLWHFQKKHCQFKLDLFDSQWCSKNQGTPHH